MIKTRTLDNEIKFTLTLPDDDRAILRLILELQRDTAAALLNAATRDLDPENEFNVDSDEPMTQFDYFGDHQDYNVAASEMLDIVTTELCAGIYGTALEMTTALFENDSFLSAIETCDFSYSLDLTFEYIEN